MKVWELGKIGFVYKGKYSDTKKYEKQDIVLYENAVYCCIKEVAASSGNAPSNPLFWDLWITVDLSDINGTIESIKLKLEETIAQVNSIKTGEVSLTDLKKITDAIVAIQTDITLQKTILEGTKASVNTNATRIDGLEENATQTKESIDTLEKKVTLLETIPSQITTLQQEKVDVAIYETNKGEVQAALNNKTDTTIFEEKITSVQTSLDLKANKADLDTKANKADLDTKANKADLDTKADKTNVYTKVQSDKRYHQKPTTYKGVRLFEGMKNSECLLWYQEVERDVETNEIVKYGDVYYKGYSAYSYEIPLNTTGNIHEWTKLQVHEEIVNIITENGMALHSYNIFIMCKNKPYIYVYGKNKSGQLGVGNTSSVVLPTKVEFSTNVKYMYITGRGNWYDCGNSWVILEDDSVYCCGYNSHGELGIGTTTASVVFIKNEYLSRKQISEIKTTYSHTNYFYSKNTKKLYGCGYNNYGQLAQGHTNNVLVPQLISEEVESFWTENSWLSDSGSRCYGFINVVKSDKRAYTAGMVRNATVSNDPNVLMHIVDKNDSVIENVKDIFHANYYGALFTHDGKLYLATNQKNWVNEGYTVLKDSKYMLFAENVKDYKCLLLTYYYVQTWAIVVHFHDGTTKILEQHYNNTTKHGYGDDNTYTYSMEDFSKANLTLPIPYENITQWALGVPVWDNRYVFKLLISDGKNIWFNGGGIANNENQFASSHGFTKLNLLKGN